MGWVNGGFQRIDYRYPIGSKFVQQQKFYAISMM
jgi:hypothetical protein